MKTAATLSAACFTLVLGCSPAHETTTRPARAVAKEPQAPTSSTTPAGRALLRVGTSGDYAPFSKRDGDAAPSGFDSELGSAFARDSGYELRYVTFRWPELAARVSEGAFDIAMSGVTWQPTRAVIGYTTRAVAHGGPCVLGDARAHDVGVNHGGVLEAWARKQFSHRNLVVVDDNLALPALLASGRVQAIVTDSFERRSFASAGVAERCEPAIAQKVYWVAPARAAELGPRLDAWLVRNGELVRSAQKRWFGEVQRLDARTHLVDLLARRLAFMPFVAGLKAAQNLPIEDAAREAEVLAGVRQSAGRLGLPEEPTLALFRLQIELSKAVQRRQREPSELDLRAQVRPVLTALGEQLLQALLAARTQGALSHLAELDLAPTVPWLSPEEQRQLLQALKRCND